eukprot:Lankesteria_metandrocarpae@DN4068_c0_g1_i1.p1
MEKRHKASVSVSNNRVDILDRSLFKPNRTEVSLSAFAFLFAEIVKYSLSQVQQAHQLENRLHELGVRVGYKVLDLLCFREKGNKREIKILNILTFVSQNCWKYLFDHSGDLLKSQDNENEYMINDKNLPLLKFISVPKDLAHLNCGAFAAGVVEGVLCSAEFPAAVSAHTVADSPTSNSTTMLICFLPEVMAREKKL